jgi:hypothetical protein
MHPLRSRLVALLGFVALAGTFAVAPASTARAGTLVKKIIAQEIADPTYRFDITFEIEAGTTFTTGNYFVIYDLVDVLDGGYLTPAHPPTPPTPPNNLWTFTTPPPPLGPYPGLPIPPDSPINLNVVWTYTGAAALSGLLELTFTVTVTKDSYYTTQPTFYWASVASTGTNAGVITAEVVPTPEPSSLVLLGLGGAGLAVAGLRRRLR